VHSFVSYNFIALQVGLGRYRFGARYPILSTPDDTDADTDTGCDVIALCGLTHELSKIFFPCKGFGALTVFYARIIRQCINRDERNTRVSKRQCIAEICLPNDVGHGDLI
jgi:hypothetical protein